MSKELLDEHFRELNVSITLFPESKTVTFKTLEKFLDFITKEKDFWQTVHNEVYTRFLDIENHINIALRSVDSNLNNARAKINDAVNLANQKGWPTVYSKTPIAQFIKKQIGSNRRDAAIQYLIRHRVDNLSNFDYFKGYISSYIFEESSKAFNEAAAAQELTLTELRNEYMGQLSALNEEYQRITTEWSKELSTCVSNWTKESEDFKTRTNEWRENLEREAQEKLNSNLSELESIKKIYTEKLRLEGPAKYWKDLEEEYEKAGNKWRWWAISITGVFVVLLTIILLFQPDYKFFNTGMFDVNSLRNALILTIISTVNIYLITLFVKLSVSSYHLARDAKERYQITHVYLSLLNENENSIKDAERITVLQSIFSRADTGLLKGDGGPTMPDSLSQILSLLKKPS